MLFSGKIAGLLKQLIFEREKSYSSGMRRNLWDRIVNYYIQQSIVLERYRSKIKNSAAEREALLRRSLLVLLWWLYSGLIPFLNAAEPHTRMCAEGIKPSTRIKRIFFAAVLFLSFQNVYALQVTPIEKEIEASIIGEYNRHDNFYGNVSILGTLDLNDSLLFKGGISFGGTTGAADVRTLFHTGFSPFKILPFEKLFSFPLDISVRYIYNGLPDYQVHTHSILPLISYHSKYIGLSVGNNFRLSSFFGENALFEMVLTFLIYVNFFHNERMRFYINCGNLSNFNAANLGALSLKIGGDIVIDKNFSAISELEFLQSGLDGFSAVFYGLSFSGGIKYKW